MAYVQLGYTQLYLRLRYIKTAGLKVRERSERDELGVGGNSNTDRWATLVKDNVECFQERIAEDLHVKTLVGLDASVAHYEFQWSASCGMQEKKNGAAGYRVLNIPASPVVVLVPTSEKLIILPGTVAKC